MLLRLVIPPSAHEDAALQKVPLGTSVGGIYVVQHHVSLGKVAGVYKLTYLRERAFRAAAEVEIAVVTAGCAVFAHLLDLVVSLVYLLHLLLRKVGKRTVCIVVGMIFLREVPIRLLYFLVGRIFVYSENFVGIHKRPILNIKYCL